VLSKFRVQEELEEVLDARADEVGPAPQEVGAREGRQHAVDAEEDGLGPSRRRFMSMMSEPAAATASQKRL